MILAPIIIGPPDGRYCPAWLSLDGHHFGCRWQGCKFRLQPVDAFGGPRLVTHEEMLEHAKSHGVKV